MRSLGWNPNETAETEEITEDEKREFQKLTDKVCNWAVWYMGGDSSVVLYHAEHSVFCHWFPRGSSQ